MVNLYHHFSGNSMNDRRKPAKRGRDAKKSLRTWKYMAGGVMLCTALMGGIAVEGSERYGISGYGVTAAAYPDGVFRSRWESVGYTNPVLQAHTASRPILTESNR